MSEQQIYKWFWDTKKKVEEDTILAREMGKGYKDENGTYKKSWAADKNVVGVDGRDGHGSMMTP